MHAKPTQSTRDISPATPGAVWKQIPDDVAGFFLFKGGALLPAADGNLQHGACADPVTGRQVRRAARLGAGAPRRPIRRLAILGHRAGPEAQRGVLLSTETAENNKKLRKNKKMFVFTHE